MPSPLTLFCADSSEPCTWEVNEGSHIVASGGNPVLLSVQGISFTGATNTSIQIQANNASVVEFTNCTWNSNEGSAVIDLRNYPAEATKTADGNGVSANVTESGSRRQLKEAKLSNESTAQLNISNCIFNGNIVTESVVNVDGADLALENCEFDVNEAQRGIVTLLGGSHKITNVSFEENDVEESGVINMDATARIIPTDVCGSGNTVGKFCNGTFQGIVDPDNCVGGSIAEACDSACVVYEACTIGQQTSRDKRHGDVVKMQEKLCFAGGNKQFRVLDGAESVSFQSLTFTGSETLSVVVEVDPSEPAMVSFIDCKWSGHNGEHVILMDPPGSLEGNDQLEANVEFTESLFFDNNVEKYVIANKGLGLSIHACEFRNNAGAKSIVGTLGGETRIGGSMVSGSNSSKKTILEGNDVKSGLFFVGLNSTGFNAVDVCGTNNTMGNSCNGTFYEASNPEECRADRQNEEACKEGCVPSVECDDVEGLGGSDCYSDWSKLVESVASANSGKAFVVCPDTDFVLDRNDTLHLDKNETVLQCGQNGDRGNRCTVAGGEVQIQILGSASGVRIDGMTFVGSSNASIAALGDGDSSATFSDCEFSGHAGEAVILVFNQDSAFEGNTSLPESMEVNIDMCVFDDNTVELAPITNLQGYVRVTKSAFSGNTGMSGAGAIVSYSRLSVSESCFVSNTGNLSGSVILSANAAQIFDQIGNFGAENAAILGNCTDILWLDESLSCDEFESVECLAPFRAESAFPSGITPSSSPAPSLVDITTPDGPCFTSEEWEALFKAISDSAGNENFTLCDDTVVDMTAMEASDWAPLLIKASEITIRCGSARRNGCVLTGGTTHIMLQGDVENILVQGVTMEQAADISVIGKVSAPFSIEFESCEWTNNTGIATVLIETTGNSTEARATGNSSSRRDLKEAKDNFFVCDRCLFQDNNVSSSILSIEGTSLILDAAIFRGNHFDGSVISTQTGSVVMTDSCVENSKFSGGVIDSKGSEVVIERIFLSENSGTGCSGYVDADGNCAASTSTTSCIAEEKRCFSHWMDLANSISNASDEGRVFTICSGATLDVSTFPAIVMRKSNTTIRCGLNGARDSNCLVTGGGIQFQILGTPTDVLFKGITFSGASIAAINAAGERSSKAQIVDCLFKNMMTGQAALLVYRGDVPPSVKRSRKLTIGDYNESAGRAMTVKIAFSSFVSNTVDLAAIANLKGTISVVNCEFSFNSGSVGGIGDWLGGSMSLATSCFTDNTGLIAGSVFVDGNMTAQKKNYGVGNTAADGDCTTILLSKATASDSSAPSLCVEFSESECNMEAAPTVAPTLSPTLPGGGVSPSQASSDCIDNWKDLEFSIDNDFNVGSENVFRLCLDKKLKAGDSPILLDQADGDVWIECGPDGRMRDNCVIAGGRIQFRIAATGIKVSFRGVTFENSSVMSIVAAADSQSTAIFDECQWTGHSGQGVVLIYNDELGQKFDGETSISELPITGDSMAAKFAKCLFAENPVQYAAISNIGGSSTISLTAFLKQLDTLAAAIVTRSNAMLSLEKCCFIENDSLLPGVVLMTEKSTLQKNEDNFGFDNRVGSSDCSDVWIVPPLGECSPTACPGTCTTFDSNECSIPGFDFQVPSSTPSATQPIARPSHANPSSTIDFGLAQTTLFASGYFLHNLVVAALVTVLGFGSFFYCKMQHEPKRDGKAKAVHIETEPLSEPVPSGPSRND
ncbi:hypothetical protein MHU86_19147 [Fragilaria crotonensis]|nr:hypothetical protein MHU86_19147 [Fragilaria crotonensis]